MNGLETPRPRPILLAASLLIALAAGGPAVAEPVEVVVDGDAHGDLAAVALQGNATCDASNGTCVAVALDGNATACTVSSPAQGACVAVAGTDDASGELAVSILGDADCPGGELCLALSGTGQGTWNDDESIGFGYSACRLGAVFGQTTFCVDDEDVADPLLP